MSELLFGLVASHGIAILLAITFLSCLAVPVPSSLALLAGGAFVASGDLTGWQVLAAALCGAVLGDQLGFEIGRRGGTPLLARVANTPVRAGLVQRAQRLVERWGGSAVFLSRWALSPLGPYVNPLAGALGMDRLRFTAWGVAGELVWVGLYVGLGFLFARNLPLIADVAGNLAGLLTAAALSALLGLWLWRRVRAVR